MLFNIFEKNAAIEPEKIAIIEDEGQITYSDLQKMIDTYVNLFTHEGAFKVDFGELVVMALPKSINQIAIILSLWKLGATVVPLNYNIGSDKLLSAASNLNAKFMIIESAIDFAQHESKKIFSEHDLIKLNPSKENKKTDNFIPYIMHTSGTSSKRQKPVAVSEINLLSIYHAWIEAYFLTKSDIHLQLAKANFDVFFGDILRSIFVGGTLILANEQKITDPSYLIAKMQAYSVSVVEFTPTVLRLLTNPDLLTPGGLNTLRWVICGSEPFYVSDYRKAQPIFPSATFVNSYGMTECTIDSTYFIVNEEILRSMKLQNGDILPVGKPFKNTSVEVFDISTEDPRGQIKAGEIIVLGEGVANGYYEQESISTKNFGEIHGNRYYRTGDFGFLKNGILFYSSRIGSEKKLNAEWVTLEDIDAALLARPDIKDSQSIIFDKKHIVTLCVPVERSANLINDIRYYLIKNSNLLTMPKSIFMVDSIPTGTNGKRCDIIPDSDIIEKFSSLNKKISSNKYEEKIRYLVFLSTGIVLQDSVTTLNSYGLSSLDTYMLYHSLKSEFENVYFTLDTIQYANINKLVFMFYGIISSKELVHKIGVIGCGATGVSLLAQMSEQKELEKTGELFITVYDSNDFGRGLPYASSITDSLIINLPATVMSPFPNKKDAFYQWLVLNKHKWQKEFPFYNCSKDLYPPRKLFGLYLKHLIDELTMLHGKLNFRFIKEPVVKINRSDNDWQIETNTQHLTKVNSIFLCSGHMKSQNYLNYNNTQGFYSDPWQMFDSNPDIPREEPIAIIGTRLTAIDTILSLRDKGYQNPLVMFSRSGALPTVIGCISDYRLCYLSIENIRKLNKGFSVNIPLKKIYELFCEEMKFGAEIDLTLMDVTVTGDSLSWLNQQIETSTTNVEVKWQSVMAAIYAVLPDIWRSLSKDDKNIFLKNYFSIFMVYMAPFPLKSANRIVELMENNILEVHGGLKNIKYHTDKRKFSVENVDAKIVDFNHVINATGSGYDVTLSGNLLLSNLKRDGLIIPCSEGGIEIDYSTQRVATENSYYSNFFALGELARGCRFATTDLGQSAKQCKNAIDWFAQDLINKNTSHIDGNRFFSVTIQIESNLHQSDDDIKSAKFEF